MSGLSQATCEACRADAPKLTAEELGRFRKEIPDWTLQEVDGVPRLQKLFRFGNFVEALAFANSVGELAESQQHHPAILIEWGRVTVSWWTHKIKGLHKNDVIMAAKTDELAAP